MNITLSSNLKERCEGICELCATDAARTAYTVTPKTDDSIENQVALCTTCLAAIESKEATPHWHCLAGSIWNVEPSVQALSYRILYGFKEQE